MNKAAPAIIGPIIGGLMIAAMGTTQGVGFDYKSAPEERQQKFLDGVAKGFETRFGATAGRNAVIERISASARWDAISVEVRLTKESAETATADQIENFRAFLYKQNCGYFAEKSLFEQDISLKMRVKRPSGAALTAFTVNEENCAPRRKAA